MQGKKLKNTLGFRTAIFLILFAITLGFSGYFVFQTQERLDLSSTRIRETLVPMRRLVQKANSDLQLQIQELRLVGELTKEENISVENLAMVRLGPNVNSLQNLHQGHWVPASLKNLLKAWKIETENYSEQISLGGEISTALDQLIGIQRTTEFLDRALEREISVQLMSISEDTAKYLNLWGIFFAIGVVWMILYFAFLINWTKPLEELKEWIARDKSPNAWAPRSIQSKGLLSGPSEFTDLVEAIRGKILKFQNLSSQLEEQASKNRDTQRSINLLFVSLQVTLQKNEELVAELIKKEKLASMGQMAAQLAHEIRNPLNSLNLKLELLREDMDTENQELIDKMTGEIDRLNALTESHLRSAKSELMETKNTNTSVVDVVESTHELIKEELSQKGCDFEFKCSENAKDLGSAIPTNVLKAALINLTKNSVQAQDNLNEKKILVELIDNQSSFELRVSDKGVGFPEEYIKAPFKIFQTTKKDGSGLGLATSKSMIEAYSGKIIIDEPIEGYSSSVSIVGPTLTSGLEERAEL